jgi:hypothetical protein
MFHLGKFERLALGAFTATLLMLIATIALARPALLIPDGEEYREPAAPIRMNMNCVEAVERSERHPIKTVFIVEMTPSLVAKSGFVMNNEIGRCFAEAPASAYNAFGGQFDMHVFSAGGNTCNQKNGDITFAIFHDRRLGLGRYATLTVKDVVFNCTL